MTISVNMVVSFQVLQTVVDGINVALSHIVLKILYHRRRNPELEGIWMTVLMRAWSYSLSHRKESSVLILALRTS